MSRTIRSKSFTTTSRACQAGQRHWQDDPERITRDGRDMGATRQLAKSRAKDFLQKRDRAARKKATYELINFDETNVNPKRTRISTI